MLAIQATTITRLEMRHTPTERLLGDKPVTSPLPDFYIGAHAAVAGLALLTRDAARYRSDLPGLEIVAPS